MDLISRQEVSKMLKSPALKSNVSVNAIMHLLKIGEVNKLYASASDLEMITFIEVLFQQLEIELLYDSEDLKNIPTDGGFVTVSNHPYGAIDGLALIYMMTKVRPDFKMVANFLLHRIKEIQPALIPVNPFEGKLNAKSSLSGLRNAIEHVSADHGLGIFPAGEVSSFQSEYRTISDKPWSKSVLKMVKKMQVPVVPVYFYGNNSLLFQLSGMINPQLRSAMLASELFRKKHQKITIRIGKPIPVNIQEDLSDIHQYGRYLRARTYALGTDTEVKPFFLDVLKGKMKLPLKAAKKIVSEIPSEKLVEDLENPVNRLLFSQGSFDMYFCPPEGIPSVLKEIGRLREITFRDVGEGTGKPTDLDEFDLYYHHLILWDRKAQKIAGSYRMGMGKEILNGYGKKGFYLSRLFKIKNGFKAILSESIELGRSFITESYQRNPITLFGLWKGILCVLLKNPDYRYLIGPVSISNQYSRLSQKLIADFIRSNYYDNHLARYIKPRNEFMVRYKSTFDKSILLQFFRSDISSLEKHIQEIEPNHYKLPVLLKKYLKQNARIIGFNRDPKFNDCLDGLIILDLFDVPFNTIQSLSKELNQEDLMERFFE